MRFKEWLNEASPANWMPVPTTGTMMKKGLGTLGKMAADLIPGVGIATNLSQAAVEMLKMRKQRRDIMPMLLKMMHQQDQSGSPADSFDLEDGIAAMLSDSSKRIIAQKIIEELDRINGQQIPADLANRQAINYINNVMKPVANRIGL